MSTWEEMKESKNVVGLIEVLQDKTVFYIYRERAAVALGNIGDERAVEPLAEALKDEDWHVRSSAALALGEIKDARAVEPLIKVLKDKNYGVRHMAVEALGKIGDKRAVEPLIEVFLKVLLSRENVSI